MRSVAADRDTRADTVRVLHEATNRFADATSVADVCDTAEAALTALRPGATAVIYVFDGDRHALRPVAGAGTVPVAPDDGSRIWDAFADDESVVGAALDDAPEPSAFGDGPAVLAPLGRHGVLVVEPTTPGSLDDRTADLVRTVANGATQALDRLQYASALGDRARERERLRSQLKHLRRSTRTLLAVETAVTDATTRDELTGAVCDELCGMDRFSFVWMGSVDANGRRIVPEAWAGTERGYHDDVDLTLGADDAEPSVRAVQERSPSHVANVARGRRQATWRRELLNRGHQSVLGLPLIHDGTLHGVLTVCASVTDAFDGVSERILGEVADATAYGIDVIERNQALVADSVLELEVQFTDPTDHFHRLARRIGGTVSFEGVVAGQASTLYLSVTSASADAVLDALDEFASVADAEHVGDKADRGLFVMRPVDPTLVSWVTDAGAAVTDLTASPTTTRLTVELPRSANARGFLDNLRDAYPDVELLAQRSHERPIESRRTFLTRLTERLTDRQLEVLKTAHLNGYFEWPRLRTGEEMAELLGITQPTFNNHLRVAERKLFTMLFDERRPE